MSGRSAQRASAGALARSLAFATAFAAAVLLGRLTAAEGSGLSLVWPAAGVATAWFCVQRGAGTRRLDTALLAGATFSINTATGAGPALAAGLVLSNLAPALVFTALRDRWFPAAPGPVSNGQFALLLAAAGAAAGASVAVGAGVLAVLGEDLVPAVLAVWWVRNAAGIVLVAPVVLRLVHAVRWRRDRHRPAAAEGSEGPEGPEPVGAGRRPAELGAALLASLAAYLLVFRFTDGLPLSFLPMAITVWAALRFPTGVVLLTDLVVAAVTVVATLRGHGPFAAIADETVRALVVQVYAVFLAVLGTALATGRDEAARLRREAERRGRLTDAVLASVGTGIVVADAQGRLVMFNDTARRWHGLDADADVDPRRHAGTYDLFAADGTTALPDEAVPLRRALAEGSVTGVEMVIAPAGLPAVPVLCSGRTMTDSAGRLLGAVVSMSDLSGVRSRERALAEANDRLAARSAQVERLAAASRAVLTAEDPRRAVCEAALGIARAHAAYLLQPGAAGRLVSTASVGLPEGVVLDIALHGGTALVPGTYLRGEPVFVADVPRHPRADPALVELCGTVSGAWQPVLDAAGHVIGVLGIVWRERVAALDPTTAALLTGLAAEAAHAFTRADLLAQLAAAADHDALTGLANRRGWDEVARLGIAHATRDRTPLTFALLDLDRFKEYNDTRGHLAGDQLLREFAAGAATHLREVDTLARWGGEEFALLLPGCDAQDALAVVDRVRGAVPDGQTCTAGVCQWQPGAGADEVMAAADAALYRGKQAGRDTTVVAEPGAVHAVGHPAGHGAAVLER
ncbi:diguanylate cyclase domain-containing protein [Kineococcus sp. SYSU DK006]|uniref:diguanylate cyclase domain-containing protein n=1 Tax=Kineococcus sp. SYSU DK006 TaxID=3383127 RepID=UPI003D7E1158